MSQVIAPISSSAPKAAAIERQPIVMDPIVARLRETIFTTPGLLRLGIGGAWFFCLLLFLAASVGIDRHHREMQTIGRDSAPSIIAAQRIRTGIADMHVQVIRQTLGAGDVASQAAREYERRRHEVTDGLVDAAENITYGDAERVPIRTLNNSLGSYEHAIASAEALRLFDKPGTVAVIRDADRILHEEILPAADALDKANRDALDRGYTDERADSGWSTVWVVGAGAVLLAWLFALQLFLFRRMHRLLNPALMAATLLSAYLLITLLNGFSSESSDLKIAKEDAFESIHALWRARACAYDANASLLQSLYDRAQATEYDARFDGDSRKLMALPPGPALEAVISAAQNGNTPEGFSGYLADELRNITFTGERDAATASLRSFADYLSIVYRVRDLNHGNDTPAAIAMALNDATTSFARFDNALGQTIQINQREFDLAVPRGFGALEGLQWQSLIAVLLVGVLVFVGVRPRLKEYAV